MRRNAIALTLATALVVASSCDSGTPQAVEQSPEVAVTLPDNVDDVFGGAFRRESFGAFGLDRLAIVPSDDPRFPAALRVSYPARSASEGSAREHGTPHGGAQLYLGLTGGPKEDLYLRYHVRFPEGFDFVKGGKLPGFFGGRVTGGGDIPDGTNGFSTRYMWRTKGAAEVYAYLPTSREHGTSLGRGNWSWATGRGTWVSVQQHVRLNSPGVRDGEIQVWLNGTPVLDQRGLTFRTTASLGIEGLFFSTFFGGSDQTWGSPTDQHVDFAGFTVSPTFLAE